MKAFDYIVIGSGSAGSVIASRLSEAPNVSVLLLEAGRRDNHPLMATPLAMPKVCKSVDFIWPYQTEPEPGLNDRKLDIWRGKTLGGCSSINAMINVRGSRYDYENWHQLGLEGWSYRDVLPYFKKLEASWRGADTYHGDEGPVGNVPVNLPDGFFSEIEQAARNAGLPICTDHNGSDQMGISRVEITTNAGRRASSARSYLHPVLKSRPNLSVIVKAHATRILFDGRRAIGVEFLRNGKLERVFANGEIVISAGTYASPQLLMLSGIGPPDHLRSVGINVFEDLPGVGANLQEHPNYLNIYSIKKPRGLARQLRVDRAAVAFARWLMFGTGPFSMMGATANIFLNTRPDRKRPDTQIILMPLDQRADLWMPGFTKPPNYAITARIGILHAQSRGVVRLRSPDPLATPHIKFNMLTARTDMDAMIDAVRWTRKLFDQSPLKELVADEFLPGSRIQTDDQLEADIRNQAEHRHHACGTCRMGTDNNAVVDAQLKVRGIDGLRVADASIMPTDPSGNTNVPTLMIGEKAADLIKGQSLEPANL